MCIKNLSFVHMIIKMQQLNLYSCHLSCTENIVVRTYVLTQQLNLYSCHLSCTENIVVRTYALTRQLNWYSCHLSCIENIVVRTYCFILQSNLTFLPLVMYWEHCCSYILCYFAVESDIPAIWVWSLRACLVVILCKITRVGIK